MKNFYLIAIFIACLFSSIGKSQNLNWTQPPATGTGNSSVAVLANAVLLNNNPITTAGTLIGAFYLDNSGNLICGGYAELTQNFIDGNNTNIAVWGSDAGEDNGFETNEIMNLYLNLDGVDYPADENTVWALGGEAWEPNGLYAISSINFTPATTSNLDPCTCADGSEGTYFEAQGFCVLQTDYCSDSSASNYCNIEGLIMLGNGSENCDFGGETINGCTCPIAVNYNPDANNDDGSCVAETGCSNPLADNYSTSGCDDITITNPNCEYSGCTCPVALGYDPDATNDDGMRR